MSKITNNCRDKIISVIETQLDTRDKRFMYLKIQFPRLVSKIQLEDNSYQAANNIYWEFEKQGMVGSLVASLNMVFDSNIELEIKE
jgi:hypothetical protein